MQIGEAPVFHGLGAEDLACRCGSSILVKGYLPANFLAIRIRCFRCGAVATTPGLAEGEILAPGAVAVEPNGTPVRTTTDVALGAVLACRRAMASEFALTQPRQAADPVDLSPVALETAAGSYDRLTGGRLGEHIASSPPAMGSQLGDYPFAWSLQRLRRKISEPGWSWLYENNDALAAMHVVALRHFLDCWGQHPLLARLASPLRAPGQFLRVMTAFAVAKMLFDDGNRVGFSLAAAERDEVGLHFSTPIGEPLSLALLAPDALQWRERERRTPEVLRAAVTDAMAAAQGTVNTRNPGIVVLAASILLPGFDQMLANAIRAGLGSAGRRHRGVAAVTMVMPTVRPTEQLDQVGFGYTYLPILNPSFAGDNPVRLRSARDFASQ